MASSLEEVEVEPELKLKLLLSELSYDSTFRVFRIQEKLYMFSFL